MFIFCIYHDAESQINTTSNRYVGCAPDTFKFYTVGNTHSGQQWNSGNSVTSNLDSPVFTYNVPGTYNVTIGSLTRVITIHPQLSFNFTTDSSKTGCFPFKFNLRDISNYPAGVSPTATQWIYQNGGSKFGNPIVDVIPDYYLHYCYVTIQVKTNIASCYGELRRDSFFKILDAPKAKFDLTPNGGCKVPFSPTITNLSTDSLKTPLTYLWTWDQPSPGTSTNNVPPTLTYTNNGLASIILKATNQYGCFDYDTIKFTIDTPQLSYTASNRICRSTQGRIVIHDLDTVNFIYDFRSENTNTGSPIYNLSSSKLIDTTYFYGFYPNIQDKDTAGYIYITKIKKSDTSCKTTVAKRVYLCQAYPIPEIKFNHTCGVPFVDTIIARNWTPCWDNIDFFVQYIDKYGIRITTNKFNANRADSIRKIGPDTILTYGLNQLLKLDEFYRRGPLDLCVVISFKNEETKCVHTYFSQFCRKKQSLFRPHLVNHYNKGCIGRKDSFFIHHYGIGSIDSIFWYLGDGTVKRTRSPILEHVFSSPGVYKSYAIVKNMLGCIDTVNSVFTYRSDSILPILSVSNKSFCITDSTTVTITNKDSFDRWYFITDKEKSFNCFTESSNNRKKFYNTGKQYIHLVAEKRGCMTQVKDSIHVSGPKFNLNYDFKCSRRDSVLFFVTDTADIEDKIYWDFGDGTFADTLKDSIWHKYSGEKVDYKVKLYAENSNGCRYEDSTVLKIRKVKAIFNDTLFCKRKNPDLILNGLPYAVNPNGSRNADYISNFNYTWQLTTIAKPGFPAIKGPTMTFGGPISIHIPEDTMNLTLIARDANGCEDTTTKRVIVTDNNIDFKLVYSDSCPPTQNIFLQNLSTSPWGIKNTFWTIYRVKNGNEYYFNAASSFNFSFLANTNAADTFRIELEIRDSASCAIKKLSKYFYFIVDTSKLIVPDTTCQELSHSIRNTENDIVKFKYRWYVNNVLVPGDTLFNLNYKFTNLGLHQIKLEKTRRATGCTQTFRDTTIVYPRPRLFFVNTFDSLANKCFPASTTISFFDSAAIPSLGFKFVHNGSPRTVNPTTIDLARGINNTEAVFWTSYGCNLVIPFLDTVYGPNADLEVDKPAICKNDSITFTLINAQDIDTVLWSFGDGTIYAGKERSVTHRYTTANAISDSIPISFIGYAPNRGCPFSKIDTVLVYEALSKHHVNNKIDTAICLGPFTIRNTAPRADYFKWRFSNGDSSLSSADSFKHSFKLPGTYNITQYAYRTPLGCVDSSISTIILHPYPKLTTKLDSICLGQKLDINFSVDLPKTSIFISPDTFKKSPYITSPIQTQITKNTVFTLTGVSEYGCRDSIKTNAFVLFPRYEKNWDTIVQMGKNIVLPVGYDPYWNYTWTPKWINPSCENCANPEMQILDSIIYNLTMEDYRKCFKNSYKYVIRLYPDILVRVPTAFSPNGDGNNDIIYARGFGIKKLLTFKIFNRQGQLLFISNDENYGWDGIYKDIPQNSDVYFYNFEAESYIPGKIVNGEGNFMLLR